LKHSVYNLYEFGTIYYLPTIRNLPVPAKSYFLTINSNLGVPPWREKARVVELPNSGQIYEFVEEVEGGIESRKS
jgi:hypothetical protein